MSNLSQLFEVVVLAEIFLAQNFKKFFLREYALAPNLKKFLQEMFWRQIH